MHNTAMRFPRNLISYNLEGHPGALQHDRSFKIILQGSLGYPNKKHRIANTGYGMLC